MNKMITSRDEVLAAARAIVLEQGVEGMNMRDLAARCNIALGSVYNYFPSKSALIFTLVEDFWKSVFRPDEIAQAAKLPFCQFVEELYRSFAVQLQEFRVIYSGQLALMRDVEKRQGKQIEQQYLNRLQELILHALEQDATIPPQVWTDRFTPKQFARFVYRNIFYALVQGEPDCAYLLELVRRLLHPPEEGVS